MEFSKTDCYEAIFDVSSRTDSYLGADSYSELKDDHHPSIGTIYNVCGSWGEAKDSVNLDSMTLNESSSRTPGNAKEINVEYFNKLTSESAYWLGFIYADAHITQSSSDDRPRFQLQISDTDEDHLVQFMDDIGSEHTLGRYNGKVSFQTVHKKFVKSILQHNLSGNKTVNGTLPDLEKPLWPHWFRGLSDGDGHIRFHSGSPNVSISGSHDRMANLQNVVPCGSSICEQSTKNNSQLCFYGDNARDIISWMYPNGENTEPMLNRKFPDWF